MKFDLYADLTQRGIIKQCTDEGLQAVMNQLKLTLYAGFDPSADSLHIGHLLPLLILRRFQLAGHSPIAVVGGATGMIGDPSGKSEERNLLSTSQIEENLAGLRENISRILDLNSKAAPARIVNNADWTQGISYLEFLRDIGKYFTINHMITKESVRARLEDRAHGISYTEFSYMLLQAFDFYHLYKQHGCTLQIGGSDQWGNITEGCELIRKRSASEDKEAKVYGLTFHLLTKSDGSKFGKTEKGAIWLSPKRTSPYQFYQFLLQSADADAIKLLNYFTFLSVKEIAGIAEQFSKDPGARLAQKTLARELTKIVHGENELKRAEQAAAALFGSEIKSLDARTLLEVFSEAPSLKLPRSRLEGGGLPFIDAVVESGLCPSKGQARKDIEAGGLYVNNERLADIAATLTPAHFIGGKYIVLRKGKKNYCLLSVE